MRLIFAESSFNYVLLQVTGCQHSPVPSLKLTMKFINASDPGYQN